MWPFKKKRMDVLELPPLPKKELENISFLPEYIPEDLPPLELKNEPERPKNEISMPENEISAEEQSPEVIQVPVKREKSSVPRKFLKMDKYHFILSEITGLNNNFDSISFEISKVCELKEKRDSRIDELQISLEDVSKKLMFIDNTLFGG